jgi:hypothetical protein
MTHVEGSNTCGSVPWRFGSPTLAAWNLGFFGRRIIRDYLGGKVSRRAHHPYLRTKFMCMLGTAIHARIASSTTKGKQ